MSPKENAMMSRITVLALASLALVHAAHAQTVGAERALLNKTQAPSRVSETKAPPVVDGARALLGQPGGGERSPGLPPEGTSRLTLGGAYRIDGERALLGGLLGRKTTHAHSALRN